MNYTTMKEITKDEFYKIINDNRLDVVVYPHTTEFKFRNGTLFGKVVEEYHDGKRYPVVTKYYVQ